MTDTEYETENQQINPLLEEFLDAPSYEAKLNVYYKLRGTSDIRLLRDIAMSLDVEVTKEDPEELYGDILYCLKTMEKFECNRLRP